MSNGPPSPADIERIKEWLRALLAHTPHLLPGSVGVITLHGFTAQQTVTYARVLVNNHAFWATVSADKGYIRDNLIRELM
jgi:hypothetical protein